MHPVQNVNDVLVVQ